MGPITTAAAAAAAAAAAIGSVTDRFSIVVKDDGIVHFIKCPTRLVWIAAVAWIWVDRG